MTNALTELFADIVLHWGAYLTALVALSGLTMSLIQVAKEEEAIGVAAGAIATDGSI